ncbi:phage tail tape measure protein [Piscirickettsia litoralis]|uniref:Phage tail tape measure protein n=1 Tax=Piscirickettsia litoralis TaxID=1891921 RepID=A0ABX3A274_9GAMM|nr:phage tail tape measure protein [Piscirickettsia litoralis]ODN41545.1 phage tail tape measure protein [Piscirickettsia litoralis]
MSEKINLSFILQAVDKYTQPIKKVRGENRLLAKDFFAVRDKLKSLKQTEKDVAQFKNLKDKTKETALAFQEETRRVRELAYKISATTKPSKKLTQSFELARKEAMRLKTAHGQQAIKLEKVRRSLNEAGISTKNLTADFRKLTAETAKYDRKLQRVQRHENILNRIRQSHVSPRDTLMQGVALAGSAVALAQPIRAAIQFESVMADVNKVANLSTPEFKAMSNSILEMSQKIPVTASGIGEIVTAAAQSGIAKNDLLDFAKTAAKMGVAFDIEAGRAGEIMASWRAKMGLSRNEVINMADAVNYLSNKMTTNAKDVARMIERQGALAQAAGLNANQVAGLSAAFNAAAPNMEMASTSMKNFLLALTKGSALSGPQAEALSQLGMNGEDLASHMQEDAEGAIKSVVDAIRDVDREEQLSIANKLFGAESISAVAPLVDRINLLGDAFKMSGDATAYANSMELEYQTRKKTTANNLITFNNQMARLGIVLGNVFLPPLNEAIKAIGEFINPIVQWIDESPVFRASLKYVVLGLMGLTAAAITTKLVGGAVVSVWTAGIKVFGIMSKVIPVVTTALRFLTMALIANPIGLAIAGIATAATLIYAYWEPIKGFFSGLWDGIKSIFSGAYDFIKSAILSPIETIKNTLGKAWDFLFGGDEATVNVNQKAQDAVERSKQAVQRVNHYENKTEQRRQTIYQRGGATKINAPINISISADKSYDENKLSELVGEKVRNSLTTVNNRGALYDPA